MDARGWLRDEWGGAYPAGTHAGAASSREPEVRHVTAPVLELTPEDLEDAYSIARLGVWRWEVGSQDFGWSAELFRIAGRDPATFVPTLDTTLDCIHLDDRPLVRERLQQAVHEHEPSGREFRVVRPDGSERHCWARINPIEEDGRVVAIRGVLLDITERRLAEVALRESEEHYRYTVELNPQIPWTADPEGNILEAAPRWLELVGSPPQEWASSLHPDDVAPTLERWAHSLATGEPVDVRYRVCQRDGRQVWFRARAGARRSKSGEILRWYGVLEDIDGQVKAEIALREGQEWLRHAHDSAGIGLFQVDLKQDLAHLSPQSLVLHGLPRDADGIFPGDSWAALIHPEDASLAREAVADAARSRGTYDFTFRVRLPDGSTRWINGLGSVRLDPAGEPERLMGVNIDVTARTRAEAALQASEALNRSIVDASPDSILLIGTDGQILFANQACRDGMELGRDAGVVSSCWLQCWPAATRDRAREAFAAALAGGSGRFAAPRPTAAGDLRWWDVVISPVLSESGEPLRLVSIARDITEQKTAEDRIQWSATHDPLTRLPNRRLFDERLAQAIADAEAAQQGLALFILDVDAFKQINDTLGHGAGDAVLRTIGARLREAVRPFDTVARLGGDEFALIMPGIANAAEAAQTAEIIKARLCAPVPYAGTSLDIRTSIGASLYPAHGTSQEELLKHADIALYASKARRGGELQIFDPHMRVELHQRVSMINLARDAVRDDRLRAFYQAKIDLGTGRVAGFEALARWIDASGAIQRPASIAAAFEDLDVSRAITDRVLDHAIGDMQAWRDAGLDVGHVALNVSTPDFLRENFAELVLERLRLAALPAHSLQVEVTESVFLTHGADLVERTLRTLSGEGVRIALDDFGTGYASLSHLKQFPIDIIKIDRSFVADIGAGQNHAAIVEAVISLGSKLGLDVVAEGVETAAQAARLRDLGCEYGQGFLFSEAVPAEAVGVLRGERFRF